MIAHLNADSFLIGVAVTLAVQAVVIALVVWRISK